MPWKKILLNTLSVLLILALFYFLGREFFHNWEKIRSYQFHFNFSLLAIASIIYVLSFIIFAFGWFLILGYLHHPISLTETILYFLVTQPAKYIPGKIWLPVARMKFCKHNQVPHSITLLSTGIEGMFEILGGTYISILAILQMPTFGEFAIWGTLVLSVLGLLIMCPPVFYFFVNIYLKIVRRPPIGKDLRVGFTNLLLLQILYIVGVLGLGFAQLFFLQSFAPVSSEYMPFLISIGVFSYIGGMVAVFAPAGLGVREGVWYLALKGITMPHIAMIYAFVSRLWTIVVEFILLLIALPILWLQRRNTKNG
jgi:uncharacterized membrane protein YbhN (UPF0104 family)